MCYEVLESIPAPRLLFYTTAYSLLCNYLQTLTNHIHTRTVEALLSACLLDHFLSFVAHLDYFHSLSHAATWHKSTKKTLFYRHYYILMLLWCNQAETRTWCEKYMTMSGGHPVSWNSAQNYFLVEVVESCWRWQPQLFLLPGTLMFVFGFELIFISCKQFPAHAD